MSESVILYKGHRVVVVRQSFSSFGTLLIKSVSGSQDLSQRDSFIRHKQAVFIQPLLFATACSKTIIFFNKLVKLLLKSKKKIGDNHTFFK